jgi:protein-arginine kinase activator protein McsA
MVIIDFLKNIWGYLAGGISLIIGLFFAKKYVDQKNKIIDLENEKNNIEAEKTKAEIEKENVEVQNEQLKDEINNQKFENNIEILESINDIKAEVKEEIDSHKDNEEYKISF